MQSVQQEYPSILGQSDICVTRAAQEVMAGLIRDSEEEFEGIRIYVQGGGCGGMAYSMTFAEQVSEYDSILELEQFKIVVDPVALGFLTGCEIDYLTEGLNSSFVFRNVFQSLGGSGKCAGCGGSGY